MTEYAELLSPSKNYAVVQLPGRNFPGVVFQGDTLNILLKDLKMVADEVASNNPSTSLEGIGDIIEQLSEVARHFEAVCEEKGFELPYSIGLR
jgi:hypothetical protein